MLTEVELCKVKSFDARSLKLQSGENLSDLASLEGGGVVLLTSDLLPLLDSVNGIRLKLKLFRATKLPVEEDDDEDCKKDGNSHAHNQPDVVALCLCWGDKELLHSWKGKSETQVRFR